MKSKIKEFFKSPHIQVALATGFSIIVLAYFSKKILSEPIGNLESALPALIMMLYELLYSKYKKEKFCRPVYWIIGILFSTILIILINFF